MNDSCPADAQSGESGCESAPLSPPSEQEKSLLAAVLALVAEMRVMNESLLQIANVNTMLLNQILERGDDDDDDDQEGKPRYLSEPGG